MAGTDKHRSTARIRIEGRHLLGLNLPVLSPAVLLKKLALHPLALKASSAQRRRDEATRVM